MVAGSEVVNLLAGHMAMFISVALCVYTNSIQHIQKARQFLV